MRFFLKKVIHSWRGFTCIGVLWYSLVTYPAQKFFCRKLPYAPELLMQLEDKEYRLITNNGYTIFVVAVKQA
jgi:hypothetical protein